MPRYLCLQRKLPGPAATGGKPSPEQMQAMFAQWNSWREKHQQSLVDLGGKLGAGKMVGPTEVIDGPFTEAKELIGGYMIISAATHDDAMQIARECPGLVRPGSGVEVIEIHSGG
jgi:hypothetical protein